MDITKHHDSFRQRGFTITNEAEMFLHGLRHSIVKEFFNEATLPPVPDTAGPVKTRYRNKDIIHYRWNGDELQLKRISAAKYARIGTGAGSREVPWFQWLSLDGTEHVTRSLLSMVPPEWRHPRGTFGLHCFRSFDSVVDGPHVDGFEFGGTYVVELTTGGAVSYIYDIATGAQLLDYRLLPGDILLFHEHFPGTNAIVKHGATALEPSGYRDALVLQIDAPEDLEAAAAEESDLGGIWQ